MKRLIKRKIPFLILIAGLSVVTLAQYEQVNRPSSRRSSRAQSRVSPMRTIQLSEPNLTGRLSIESVLAQRRSVRQFAQKGLNYSQIGQLAWAGQGITEPANGLRTAPSAGSLFPMTLYIAISKGLFIYRPENHSLEQVAERDIRQGLASAAMNQNVVRDAPCNIIIAGSVTRLIPRYQNESRKFMILEAGHVAQNILLQAVGLNLASVPIGGFNSSRVNDLCQMSRDMEPLYIISIGHYQTEDLPSTKRQPTTERGLERNRKIDMERPKVAILIVPSMNFNESELSDAQRAMTDIGVVTNIASTKRGTVTGTEGRRSRADMLITQINLDDCDGIVFIGGMGINEYAFDPYIGQLVNNAISKGKIVGAISNAPNILANAGVINGFRVTALPSEQINLERSGAEYTGSYVEKDGQIITGMNPQAARQFGNTFGETLNQLFGGTTTYNRVRIRSGPEINYTQ
ncbi:MAG: DJ-1/PfpI family protein [Planctomycetota bacterium]|jgi:SagB-type dehydrogenase family enzyme